MVHSSMTMRAVRAAALLLGLAWLAPLSAAVEGITVPAGFDVTVWAADVPNARSLVAGGDGTVYVSTRRDGRVWALRDRNGDGVAESRHTLAQGLKAPNGVAWRDGALYVAEIHRILRFDNIGAQLDKPPAPVILRDDLPSASHHGWRYLAFGPDGKLYLSLGAPCNVCETTRFERDGAALETASITRMNADGSHWEVVARGVRNSVGFDWQPSSGELWFTDNGRDWLGDNQPQCELNRLSQPGAHFGFPYCHAGTLADPEFGKQRSCADTVAPRALLGPHVAPLGMRFYRGSAFPEPWRGSVFVALHGSWNRSEKSGYQVLALREVNGRMEQTLFMDGFLQGQQPRGRPVDLLELPDGSLLVSDDHAGRILRVRWAG